MIESWVASTQNWMNARFADWDTRNPPPAEYVIVSDTYDPTLVALRPAVTRTPAPEPVLKAPETKASAAVNPVSSTGRRIEPASKPEMHLGVFRTVSFVRQRRTFSPLEVPSVLHQSIADVLNRHSEGLGLDQPRISVRPRFQPLTIAASQPRTVVDELNARNEGIGIIPPKAAPRLAPKPRFEPIAVPSDLQVGVAYELNARNEGIGIKPPVIATVKPKVSFEAGFAAMAREPLLYFAVAPAPTAIARATPREAVARPTAVAKAAHTIASPAQVVKKRQASKAEENDTPEDTVIEVAGEVTTLNDGFGSWTVPARPAVGTSAASAVERAFGPFPMSNQLFGGIAFELSLRLQAANRLALAADPVPAPATAVNAKAPSVVSASPSSKGLRRAVSLTREALYAWVNVLTGPAIVTVSHSR
jgi:hypothetical protein